MKKPRPIPKRKILVGSFLTIATCLLGPISAHAAPDPQMQVVLEKLASLGGKPIETLSAKEARKQPTPADAVMAVMKDKGIKPPEYSGKIDTTDLKLGDSTVKARIYTPKGDGPFPAVLYIHGGGWVIASIDVYESSARALAIGTGAVVVATEYRFGPEDKFPAAHNDTFGAYQYLLGNAKKLKINPAKIALVGESAGGNMAIDICMAAKEKGITPPVHQVLVYPVANGSAKTSPSMEANVHSKPLDTPMLPWFFKNYLKDDSQATDLRLSPALAGEKLKGLPPATIIAAEIDPLLSGVEQLSEALKAQGVSVNYMMYPGVTHEFFGMGTVVDKAKEAEDFAIADLTKAFAM